MKVRLLITSLLLLLFSLDAQEMKLYAPFPSRLSVRTSGNEIILSWKDAVDVDEGIYEVYRADRVLTADNLNSAVKIADVPAGEEMYTDQPPTGEEVFYAVFVRDGSQTFKICIPYRNVTTSPASIDESDIEETRSTIVSNLEAKIFQSDVAISFNSSDENRNILIFRSTSPIDSYTKLIKSVLVHEESGGQSSLIDNPIAGLNYYYAAVDAELYRSGNRNVLYNGNYTVLPVYIKFDHEITDDSRFVKSAMPLPLLKISSDLKSGALLEKNEAPDYEGSLSAGTLRIVERLSQTDERLLIRPLKTTLAYNRNINSIVTTLFAAGAWERCADELESFISTQYDSETIKQCHFYRGQCYFYLGRYKKALLEMIMVEKDFYRETQPFLKAIYEELKRES